MRRSARTLAAGSAALGLVVSTLLWQVPLASAQAGCRTSSSDFDRDGTADVAVGAPGASGRQGAVHVRLSNNGRLLTSTITGSSGFGTAITSLSSYVAGGDLALCSQLVVGSPDESSRTDRERSGAVYVYYWNASAHRFALRSTFSPQAQGVKGSDQSGARFGAALAADQRPADETNPRPRRLYVGAPGFDLDGYRDAGRVTSFWIDDDEDPRAHDSETFDYGDDFTPGFPSAGAALGSSLTIAGGLVAAGAPGHRAQAGTASGAVLVAPADPRPDDFLPVELSQATRGVPGTPEKGDRFGAAVHLIAVAGQSPTLLVGAPGEDVGRTADAGAVTITRLSPTSGEPVGQVQTVNQDSAGLAGAVEAADAFGSALSSTTYAKKLTFLVGSPGEDVGRVRDAGMVQTVGGGGSAGRRTPRAFPEVARQATGWERRWAALLIRPHPSR